MRSVTPARFVRCSMLAAIFVGYSLCGPPPAPTTVSISVDTLGNASLTGPAGVSALSSAAAADPGPGGLGSVLTYTLLNPPSLVFGDVQLTGPAGVSELIRFNAAGTGNPGYLASLLFYSSPADGGGHLVNTPTPPATLYPNVVSVPLGTVYTPGPGQPGYVASVVTHYTFGEPACNYSFTPSSINVSGSGASGSFSVLTGAGCPIMPVSLSSFVSVGVTGSIVNFTVAPNPALQPRTGTIMVGGQLFNVEQSGAVLVFSPTTLVFTSTTGPPPAQTVNVSGPPGSFTLSVSAPWVTVTSNSMTLPATLTVTVNPAGLTPGYYGATITLNVDGTPEVFSLIYSVQALPGLVPVPAQLSFNYSGGALPAAQQLEIYSTSPVAFQAAGSGFVSVTPASGTATQTIAVSVNPSQLTAGTHLASVIVTANGVTNSPLVIPVTLNVTSTGPPAPQLTSAGVVNAGSFLAGPIAPGSLFTVFGTNLADTQASAPGPGLPTSLEGVSITIGGVLAPLLFISPGQINAQVPVEVALGQQPLVATFNGASTTVQVTIVPAAPGIFLVNGRGAILNQDSSLNEPGNPALSGSTVQVYFTGQGLVTPPVATGAPAPLTTLSTTNATTTATIGTQPATVAFSGLAPSMVGLGQANVVVPSLPTNDYPLVLTINGVQSNSGTLAVKTQ
jgi:uncharacterized protein (TIGR03437 family)